MAVIGLLLAILVLIIGAYKGLGALPLTLLASLVVMVTNGIPIWGGLTTNDISYMSGYTGVYKSFFLLFVCSSLYANLMDTSGSAASIGYQFIDWFGKKKVMLVCTLIVSALTYGGVSLFVVVYAVAPIMFLLFKEANLPRHMTMACLITGSATYTMTALPGTPSLTNVIPTQFLGTTLTAAPVIGIVCSIAMFVMCMGYMGWEEKRAVAAGEGWTYPENIDPALYEIKDRSQLPSVGKAFAPIVVLLAFIIIGSNIRDAEGVKLNSTMIATYAMLIGSFLTYVLNLDRYKDKSVKDIITSGLEGGIDGIGGLAGVTAFGAVVQSTAAFQSVVDTILSMEMNPYVQGTVSTMAISAVTGSSSGGLRIMYTALAENFIASGANLDVLHRLTSISADALDTLPHSPGLFLTMAVVGLTHKNSYKHVFACSTIIPLIVTFFLTIFCIFAFPVN